MTPQYRQPVSYTHLIDTARVLIEGGANLHLKNHEGQTPLDFAKARRSTEIAQMIEAKLKPGER